MRTPSRRLASSAPPPMRGRVSFALVCSLVIGLTMAALLTLNIAAARSSYAQEDLAARLALLTEEQQALREELEAHQAPSSLEAAASGLGMVAANRAFVSMRDGELLGDASPARLPPSEQDADPDESPRGVSGGPSDEPLDPAQDPAPDQTPDQTSDQASGETPDAVAGSEPEDRSTAASGGEAGAPTSPGDAP